MQDVMQFYLPQTDVAALVEKYGKGICFSTKDQAEVVRWCSQRKYAIYTKSFGIMK